MKNILSKNRILILITTILVGLLTGCGSAHYSSNKKKQVIEEHKQEVEAWFDFNYPDATKVSYEPYIYTDDLLAAIEGDYTIDHAKHHYIYDYNNEQMYTDELYEDVCHELKSQLCETFGLEEDKTVVTFHGLKFETSPENDAWENDYWYASDKTDVPDKLSSKGESVMPAQWDLKECIDGIKKGNILFNYSVYTYRDDFFDYNKKAFKEDKNLISINCMIPIDPAHVLSKDVEYYRDYNQNGYTSNFCHLENVEKGIYAGYLYEGDEAPEEYFESHFTDKNNLTIEIPDLSHPIILFDHNVKLDCNGIEEKSMYKESCPGWEEYTVFDSTFVLPSSITCCFERSRDISANGLYAMKYR